MTRDTWVPIAGGVLFAVFLWVFVVVGYFLADILSAM